MLPTKTVYNYLVNSIYRVWISPCADSAAFDVHPNIVNAFSVALASFPKTTTSDSSSCVLELGWLSLACLWIFISLRFNKWRSSLPHYQIYINLILNVLCSFFRFSCLFLLFFVTGSPFKIVSLCTFYVWKGQKRNKSENWSYPL